MAVTTEAGSAEQRRLLQDAERLLPGGALGMFRLPDDVRMVIREGRGSKLYDVDGREYLDYLLGSGPMILGHCHSAVVEAMSQQVARGWHFFQPTEPTIALAEKVVRAAPCADQVKFVGSGSEATMFALRLARAFTGRDKIMKFEGGYHGVSDYAQFSTASNGVVTGGGDYPRGRPSTAGIPRVLYDQVLVAPFNDLETTTRLIAEHAADLAAVIVEPLQRSIAPRDGFLEGLRGVAREHGVLIVFDEVVTGFRLAWGGAQEYYGASCDLAAYGKALSGGFPMAAIAGRRDVMALTDPTHATSSNYTVISGTHAGNPLGAAAGLATLAELERPGVYERLHAVGNRLRAGLAEVGSRVGLPLQLPGEGPAFQPVISEHPVHDAADLARADQAATSRFGIEMLREGVLYSVGSKMYVSTAHTDADVDRTLEAAERALRRVAN